MTLVTLPTPNASPRRRVELVKAVAGKNFVELPGVRRLLRQRAATYNLTEPEMVTSGCNKRKIENILKTKADLIVTTNPGCLLQIRAGLEKAGCQAQVMHIADYLAEAYDFFTTQYG